MRAVAIFLLVANLALPGAAFAANHDSTWRDTNNERETAECNADPSCRNFIRNQEALDKRKSDERQARWESKSFAQKLEPYLYIAAALFGFRWWLNRKK